VVFFSDLLQRHSIIKIQAKVARRTIADVRRMEPESWFYRFCQENLFFHAVMVA
jgi:hypothetical protein